VGSAGGAGDWIDAGKWYFAIISGAVSRAKEASEMRQQMKSFLKKAIRSAGYDIRRRGTVVFPYLRRIEFAGQQFEFWIADECGRLWYHEVLSHMIQETKQLQNLIEPGDRVLEVGCHHGFYTVLLAQRVGSSGFICGVEASPENALIAQAQVTLNHLGGHAIVIHAAGSDNTEALHVRSGNEGGNNHIVVTESIPSLEVQAITGDELDEKYGPFDVLKLDVEGFESKVLKGCKGMLERRPRIAIEVHGAALPGYGSSAAEVLELLHLDDYEGFMVRRPAYTLDPIAREQIVGDEPVNLFLRPIK
jgi:FkbM family methyltransferase